MSSTLTAILIACAAWWLSTGALILVARWGERHKKVAMAAMSVIAAIGIAGLIQSSTDNSVAGVYHGFASALALWAWHEAAFLLGVVTGPRKIAMSSEASGFRRFAQAYETIRDHELLLFACLVVMIFAFAGAENHMGLLTFALLWVMRLSTKLNLFFGAPNAVSDMLPARLDYLTSYFRTDRINGFFWISILSTLALTAALIIAAFVSVQSSALVALVLLASFAALALVEHLFLILPIRDSSLWAWFVPGRSDLQPKQTPKAIAATDNTTEFTTKEKMKKHRAAFGAGSI